MSRESNTDTAMVGRHEEPTARVLAPAPFEDDSTFIHCIRAVRFSAGRSLALTNRSLVERSARGLGRIRLDDREAIICALVQRFGMTGALVREAISGLDLDTGSYPEQ